jgi:hypothetical protein
MHGMTLLLLATDYSQELFSIFDDWAEYGPNQSNRTTIMQIPKVKIEMLCG